MKNRDQSRSVVGLDHVQRVNLDVRTVSDRVRKLERKALFQESIVTALPSDPVDGQTVILQTAAMLSVGVSWQFRYSSSGGTYPWKFVGGVPWTETVSTSETTASTTYTDLATVGPQITVPAKGQFVVTFGATEDYSVITSNRVAFASLNNAGGTPADSQSARSGHPNIVGLAQSVSRTDSVTIAAAGDVLKLQYRAAADTARFAGRFLSIIPVHVSL